MSFDLNIDNYTISELIQMFELPENFDKNIIEIKESKLRDNIINNTEINKDVKVNTINFLSKAKNMILKKTEEEIKKFTTTMKDIYNSSYELKTVDIESGDEHMIQVRKEPVYLNSFPGETFPGIINPLKKRTVQKVLNIDTRFRDNYYASSSTNFTLNLPMTFNDVTQMQLASIELPTTYYVVSKQYNNNFFSISVNGESTVIKIPDGNYDQTSIMSIINTQLINAGTPFNLISFSINTTNGSGSGQTIVAPITEGTVSFFDLNFQSDINGNYDKGTPLPLKFGWLLGFRNGVYTNNLNYVSEGIVDFSGPRYLYLVVNDYNNNVNNLFFGAFNSSMLNKDILARISLQSSTFSILEQNTSSLITLPREYFGPVNLVNLQIQLLDEYGRIVNLNNMDFSFCINLKTIYDV